MIVVRKIIMTCNHLLGMFLHSHLTTSGKNPTFQSQIKTGYVVAKNHQQGKQKDKKKDKRRGMKKGKATHYMYATR